ncbi:MULTISPECIES: YceK/YidQ family lipoprotein [Pseudomonas]|uniref:YceK/YidQ family lipoprotein n=1 Tax=Pseudomonas azadiae TaxID=2843612 RepID=A0ABS6P0P7_9PSED|nr:MULTISPECIES: YceK/YidQ family lipoprotein [Pseudomonas]MBV4454023.1 YceK/YidQ family lipoprotein [Pseudomonas azadiae]NMF43424.1 YceK/YidQ family lipoprotein [Pseudomonas sp. SWRI 103]
MTIRTLAVLGIVSLAASGCGTLNTVFREDIAATRELRKQKTYCEAIPRIYSGLAFDFCLLHATPDPTGVLIPLALADIAASGVLDTMVLPYTVYRQIEDGNIRIYR